MTELDRVVCTMLAVLISLIVTLLEGVSLRGSDNVIVPMATFYFLVRFTTENLDVINTHLFTLLAILVLVTLFGFASSLLRTSGVMTATSFLRRTCLAGQGGFCTCDCPNHPGSGSISPQERVNRHDAQHQVLATLYAVVVMVALVVHDNIMSHVGPEWLLSGDALRAPFVGLVVGQLTMMLVTQLRPFQSGSREPTSVPVTLGLFVLAMVLVGPGLRATGGIGPQSLFTSACIAGFATLFYWLMRKLQGWPARTPWNMRLQPACLALAILVVLPVHFLILGGG